MHRAKQRQSSTIKGETLVALLVKPAAINRGLVLIAYDSEVNKAERILEENIQA